MIDLSLRFQDLNNSNKSRQDIKEESFSRSLLLIKDKNLDQFRAKPLPSAASHREIKIFRK